MTYRVVVTPNAEQDLKGAYRYIREHAPQAAGRWLKGARRAIKTLAKNPQRCPFAPESESLEDSIHELFYGSGNRGTYRILFAVVQGAVYVLHVRHGSMQPLTGED